MRIFKIVAWLIMLSLAISGLIACDKISGSSSEAGQDFTTFSPNVQAIGENLVPTNVVDTSPDEGTTSTSTTDSTGTDTTTTPQISTQSLAGTGIVWKPVSEGDGNLVVLTPTSYGKPDVSVLDASGVAVETGRYVGHTNGNRATYRFSRPGAGFSAPAYLKVGGSVFLVSSPPSRYN